MACRPSFLDNTGDVPVLIYLFVSFNVCKTDNIFKVDRAPLVFYSCGLSTATIEYSCLSVCLSVCVCVCVCLSVFTITKKIMVQTT